MPAPPHRGVLATRHGPYPTKLSSLGKVGPTADGRARPPTLSVLCAQGPYPQLGGGATCATATQRLVCWGTTIPRDILAFGPWACKGGRPSPASRGKNRCRSRKAWVTWLTADSRPEGGNPCLGQIPATCEYHRQVPPQLQEGHPNYSFSRSHVLQLRLLPASA